MDAYVERFFVDNFSLFKYTHPNFITLSGLLLNFVIYYALVTRSMSPTTLQVTNCMPTTSGVLFFLFIIRWLLDVLDGAVARKYGKQSKLGGYLDTLSDFVFFMLMYDYIVVRKFGFPIWYNLFFVAVYLLIMFSYNSISDHTMLKCYNHELRYMNILPLLVNNSLIPYLAPYFIIFCIN